MKIYRDVIIKSLTSGLIVGTIIGAYFVPILNKGPIIPKVMASNVMEVGYKAPMVDTWVALYSDKFGRTLSEKNHTKELLHCLLYNESGYGYNKGYGDSGLAGGPLQYHQSTWDGFRKIMLKRGLITEIGDRENMEQAIETTAWAIIDGRSLNWGPVYRGDCI